MAMRSIHYTFHYPARGAQSKSSAAIAVLKGQSSGTKTRLVAARALASDDQSQAQLPPEDLKYIAKLLVSCLGASLVIKYSSVLLPELTRPNISQALGMILSPVVVSVVTLSVASLKKKS